MRRYAIERSGDGPDYYPLTIQELIELLDTAIAILDHQAFNLYAVGELASIQIRLGQAIPGSWTPTVLDSEADKKLVCLDEAFTTWIKDPLTLFLKEQPLTEESEIVKTLWALMQ